METTIGPRIKQLRTFYGLSIREFAHLCGLSRLAVFNLESNKTQKPHPSSLQKMVNVFGTTVEWLLTGKDEMLPNGMKEIFRDDAEKESLKKDEAYLEIKSKNMMLEKEVERLWQILDHFMSDSRMNLSRIKDAS